MLNTSENHISELIQGVSFPETKARHIKKVAEILHEKYNDCVPQNYKEILGLPGVGPKMALLYFQFATGHILGISVDTHVHRVANRL